MWYQRPKGYDKVRFKGKRLHMPQYMIYSNLYKQLTLKDKVLLVTTKIKSNNPTSTVEYYLI